PGAPGRRGSASPRAAAAARLARGRRRIGEWSGGHRSEGGRRGVSVGVIAALITVIVVVAAVILWKFFGAVLADRSGTAAARCVDGDATIGVVADPSVADQIRGFAEEFSGSGRQVGDRCVTVNVESAASDAVINGFIGGWPGDLGERPALWIPASSISAARLSAAVGAETISDSRSLAVSPVLLAIRPELKPALADQDWAALPRLQTAPDALDRTLPGWGSLRLALPVRGNSDASYLAAEAVATAAAPAGEPASAGTAAVRTLLGAQPKLADDSLTEAMNVLLDADDPAAAPVHAVVTTEQQAFARGQAGTDRTGTLTTWLPPGPVAVADYPTVLLAGSWLSSEQEAGASEFARFLRKPEQLDRLAEAGFRVPDTDLPDSDVTDFPDLPDTLAVGDDSARATIATVLTAPANGPAVTVMLDESMSEQDGAKTRLANVTAALGAGLHDLPPDATVGLWLFDGVAGRSAVASGPLETQLDTLTARLDGLSSQSGGAVSFTTLRLVYDAALADYREGRPNSVLVITTGPHTDRTLDGPGLQDYIRGAVDPARPVAVNVLDLGDDSDRATWEAVAQLSGGSYRHLASSDSPELATALAALLG
ncbi:substrate-binding domain-containing protein, partial [Mycobacterium sp. 1274756.6]|uniref:substrate-binding domain-containing protein n=1 Tax=Mycobacterium sp. 1274756.6 TaxID=1834076 RepID=UPI00080019B2